MNKSRQAAIVVALSENLQSNGSWCGETHVQKSTYFLQKMAKVPLSFEFVMYKHGPFSFDLRDELAALRADGLLELETRPYPYGPTLVATEVGRDLERRYRKTLEKTMARVALVARQLGGKRASELEQLATALYVKDSEPDLDANECARRVTEYKSHVDLNSARTAVREVERYSQEVAALETP